MPTRKRVRTFVVVDLGLLSMANESMHMARLCRGPSISVDILTFAGHIICCGLNFGRENEVYDGNSVA